MVAATMLSAALEYAAKGWPVFPVWPKDAEGRCCCGKSDCSSPGKHPIGLKDFCPRGVNDATTDEARIREWWGECPNAGVAIRQGGGRWVLDEDQPGAADQVLPESILTAIVRTPRGGRHFYFLGQARNSTNPTVGIDTRGEGGYVVAPPTPGYVWVVSPEDAPLAHFDPPLIGRQETPRAQAEQARSAPTRPALTAYAAKALEDELATLRQAQPGSRNDTLNRVAFALGTLHGADLLHDCRPEILAACPAFDPSFTEAEATKTLNSGWEAGVASPRSVELRQNAPPKPRPAPGPGEQPYDYFAERNGRPVGWYTEGWLAEMFRDLYYRDFRYTSAHGWLGWDGRRWRIDDTGQARRRLLQLLGDIRAEKDRLAEDPRKALMAFLKRAETDRGLGGALNLAASMEGIAARHGSFDRDPWLLTCLNGTIDLRTGTLLSHDQRHGVTRVAPVEFHADAPTPMWDAFLERVLPKPEVRSFVRRAVGYSLTGSIEEQCLFFLYGVGGNGKSVFIETLARVLGEYAIYTPFDTFQQRRAGAATNDLARLQGARIVRSSEPDGSARFSEAILKQLTGGEPVAARHLYRDYFEYIPQFAVWLVGNHKPRVTGTDEGIWRRMRLVPFLERIQASERQKGLEVRLAAEEGAGILAWAVRGCLEWRAQGLGEPKDVVEATRAYRAEEDVLGAFLEECCESLPGTLTPMRTIRAVYEAWCKENGHHAVGGTAFGRALSERGYEKVRKEGGVCRIGIVVTPDVVSRYSGRDTDADWWKK